MNDRKPYLSEKDYPFNLEDDSDTRRPAGALLFMAKAMDDLLSNPPSDMKGEYYEDQRAAWDGDQGGEIAGSSRSGIRGTIDDLANALGALGNDAMQKAGLIGRAGTAKFRQIRDAVTDFWKLRSAARANRMLHACVYLLASLGSITPGVEAIKEVFEGFKDLADLAVARS